MGITLLIILLCLLLLNIPAFLEHRHYTMVVFDKDEISFDILSMCCLSQHGFIQWFDAAVRCLVPFKLILICNICIIFNFIQYKKRHQNMTYKEKNKEKQNKEEKTHRKEIVSLTFLLLTVSFTYIILTLPYTVYILFVQYMRHDSKTYSISEIISSKWLLYNSSLCLLYLNNSVNFFLYCARGENFKERFLVMCGCRKKIDPRQKIIEQALLERNMRLLKKEASQNELKLNDSTIGLNISNKETMINLTK